MVRKLFIRLSMQLSTYIVYTIKKIFNFFLNSVKSLRSLSGHITWRKIKTKHAISKIISLVVMQCNTKAHTYFFIHTFAFIFMLSLIYGLTDSSLINDKSVAHPQVNSYDFLSYKEHKRRNSEELLL